MNDKGQIMRAYLQSDPIESSRSVTSASVGFWPHALRRSPRLAF